MLQKIGFMIMCIGAMLADSENILVPVAVVGLGAILIWFGLGTEDNDETI